MKVLCLECSAYLRRFLEKNHMLVVAIGDSGLKTPRGVRIWIEDDGIEAVFFNLDALPWSYDTVAYLRRSRIQIPLIGIKATGGTRAVWLDALELFLGKGGDALFESMVPCHKKEREGLLAQLYAIERRRHGILQNTLEFRGGDAVVSIDIASYEVRVNGEPVGLSGIERRLMRYLAVRHGAIHSRESIHTNLYRSPDVEPLVRTLDVHLCHIAKKLARIHPDARRILKNVHGTGVFLDSCHFAEQAA